MILFAYSAPLFSQLDLDIYYDAEGANASHFPKILRIIVKGRYYGYTPFAYNYTPQLPTITPPNCLQLHPLTTYSYTPPHRVRLVVTMATPYGDLTTKNLVISPTRFSSDRINSSNPMDLKCSIAVVFVIGTFLASACSD